MSKEQAFKLGRTFTVIAIIILSFGLPLGGIPACIALALVWYGCVQ